MRILIAQDEQSHTETLMKIFKKNNYSTDAVYSGENVLSYLLSENYDVAILDMILTKSDGISILKQLRSKGNHVPVLILSSKTSVSDKVLALDSGANYYLTKPYDTNELLAVVRALTRIPVEINSTLSFGNITLNRASYELTSPTASLRLAHKEYQMLELFMSNPHHVIPAQLFIEKIWGFNNDIEMDIIWVYISYIRKKLRTLHADVQIKAYRNAGYSLEVMP